VICAPDEDKAFFQHLMNYALRKYGQSCWILGKDLKCDGSANVESLQSYGIKRGAIYFEIQGVDPVSDDPTIGATIASIRR
jgi:hypothetical protein